MILTHYIYRRLKVEVKETDTIKTIVMKTNYFNVGKVTFDTMSLPFKQKYWTLIYTSNV